MKGYVSFFILLLPLLVSAQKERLEGDDSRFLCATDSLRYYFKTDTLDAERVDSLLELWYFYDNGRVEEEVAAFIWKKAGKNYLKIFTGCDETSETSIIDLKRTDYFTLFHKAQLDTSEIYLLSFDSHEYGYDFTISEGQNTQHGYVRNSRRGYDASLSPRERKKNKKEAEKDPFIYWLNDLHRRIVKELKKVNPELAEELDKQ